MFMHAFVGVLSPKSTFVLILGSLGAAKKVLPYAMKQKAVTLFQVIQSARLHTTRAGWENKHFLSLTSLWTLRGFNYVFKN